MPWPPSFACVTRSPCSSRVLVIAKTFRASSSITSTCLPRSAGCSVSAVSEVSAVDSDDSVARSRLPRPGGSLRRAGSGGTRPGWAADRCRVIRSRSSSSERRAVRARDSRRAAPRGGSAGRRACSGRARAPGPGPRAGPASPAPGRGTQRRPACPGPRPRSGTARRRAVAAALAGAGGGADPTVAPSLRAGRTPRCARAASAARRSRARTPGPSGPAVGAVGGLDPAVTQAARARRVARTLPSAVPDWLGAARRRRLAPARPRGWSRRAGGRRRPGPAPPARSTAASASRPARRRGRPAASGWRTRRPARWRHAGSPAATRARSG